jgi:hypothetical protein
MRFDDYCACIEITFVVEDQIKTSIHGSIILGYIYKEVGKRSYPLTYWCRNLDNSCSLFDFDLPDP